LNHAVYFPLMEEARFRYLRECGIVNDTSDAKAIIDETLTQHSANISYRSPGKGGNRCFVRVATLFLGTTSVIQRYQVGDVMTRTVWVECVQTLTTMCAENRGQKAPMDPIFRQKIAAYEQGNISLDSTKPMSLPTELEKITDLPNAEGIFRFKQPVHTRWVDEDQAQLISADLYWTAMEEGRIAYFSKGEGLDLMYTSPRGAVSFPFVLSSAVTRYFSSSHGGETLLVDVRTTDLGPSAFTQQYRVRDANSGQVRAESTQVFVMWDVEKKQKKKMEASYDAKVREFEGLPPAESPATVDINVATKGILAVGDSAALTKTFTPADMKAFANVSEDRNPLHLDPDFAAETQFKTPIVHGAAIASLFSGILGLHFPGPGTVYLSQNSSFVAPLHVGKTCTARVSVTKIRPDKPIVTLTTMCERTEDGKVCAKGEAVVMVPKAMLPPMIPKASL